MKKTSVNPFLNLEYLTNFLNINKIIEELSISWPEHLPALASSLLSHSDRSLSNLEDLCKDLLLLSGIRTPQYLKSYRWMCNEMNNEQLFFMRHKRYRRTTFKEAFEDIYSNKAYMKKYMEGLLFSQFLWSNHAKSYLEHRNFIESIPNEFSYLEIGPGHGFYLSTVARNSNCNYLEAWDVSAESLMQTKNSLSTLNILKPVNLVEKDVQSIIFSHNSKKFDIIVISEVLEHLENPLLTLKNLYLTLSPNGKIFINFPINSPAPDHIFLLSSLNEVCSLVIEAGFKIVLSNQFPASGYDIEYAMKIKSTISCIVIAEIEQ